MFQALSVVIRALSWFPIRLLGLGKGPFALRGPWWSRGFYVFEVAVRVALNVLPEARACQPILSRAKGELYLLAVHHLLVSSRILPLLLRLSGHRCLSRAIPRLVYEARTAIAAQWRNWIVLWLVSARNGSVMIDSVVGSRAPSSALVAV